MRGKELLRLVWLNITQNKFKVIMTSIGIIVGAATIVMVIAIGKGGQADVADQFKNLNAGAIDISYDGGSSQFSGGFGPGGGDSSGGGPQMGDSLGGGGSATQMDSSGSDGNAPQMNNSGDGGSAPQMDGTGENGGGPQMGENTGDGNMPEMDGDGTDETLINQEDITLSMDDVEDILTFADGISDATISYTTRASVDGGELEEAGVYTLAGVKENYASMSNLEISVGEFITDADDENKEKVCILGATVAEEIFGSAINAYGSVIYIDDRQYVVNGVLQTMGTVSSGISPDDAIFIPYETGIKYIVGTNADPTITVIAEDVNDIDTVIENVTAVLARSYENCEFTFEDAGSKMEAASASNQILTMLLIAMAVIVFIVGGIGIMNVLFVSVKERTNEIGILKAIGCSQKNILLEFLLEAAAISLIGGILGIGASFIAAPVVQYLGVRVEMSVSALVLALIFAVGTGTIFGFYPALKASRLVPVDALGAE